jgi:hypothetical protein
MTSRFKVGDKVAWTSQAKGVKTEKHGEIVAVVPACWSINGIHREIVKATGASSTWGGGMPRDHESYLVLVRQGGARKPKLYHPRVSALELD